MLQKAASALDELREQVVFVGGAVVELYATDPAAPPVRSTIDVDCAVRITSRGEYRQIEESLEERGFRHDRSENAPICRWLYGKLILDVMPTDECILGFANRWHAAGMEHTVLYTLPDGCSIRLLSPSFFVASKLEALHHRGGEDWRGEPDFEDVIFLVDNRAELPIEVREAPDNVRAYLGAQFESMLGDPMMREDVLSVMPRPVDTVRLENTLMQMRKIAGVSTDGGQ